MGVDPADEISVTEAAELLGLTRPSLFYLLRSGALTSRRVGHQHILSRAEVLAHRTRQAGKDKRGPTPGAPRSPRYGRSRRDDGPAA